MIVRNGWYWESIDCHSWRCPGWVCQKCGDRFWSWFDDDNGDEAYDTEAEDEDEDRYEDFIDEEDSE